jgi:tetratricopeptide (TPR) repeat protein
MTVESPPAPSSTPASQRALGVLRESPALVPALAGVALLLLLGASEGGIEPTTWRPVALVFLALLIVSLIALPRPAPSRLALVAMALLSAYALWSFASIAWADSQGPAVEGAGRTLAYVIIFALFALWPLRGAAPAILLGAFGLGVAAIGLVELMRISTAADPLAFMFRGRVAEPLGYANANVAFWMSGAIPCAVLAARRELAPLLRGLLLGGAGLLIGMALLGQSRGWLLAVPLVALLAIAIAPGRGRLIVVLGALGVGTIAMLDPVLNVYEMSGPGIDLTGPIDDAARAIVFTAAALTVAGTIAAFLDAGVRVSQETARNVSAVVVGATVVVLVLGAIAVASQESPITRVENAWQELKEGDSAQATEDGGSRLTRDLSTHRYDFWRIAWENFERAPLVGVGLDNFQQDYLKDGDSSEAPRYPHSFELSVLSETGILGALLLLGAITAALVAAAPGLRSSRGLGAAGSAGALLLFAYWAFHGSVDWLWEFPALGGAAFAMLGTAVAAATRPAEPEAVERRQTTVQRALVGVGALAAALILALPWLSERQLERAIESDGTLQSRIDQLDRAASLNPFSSRPDLAAGSIAVVEGRPDIAAGHFDEALERDPRSAYAALMDAAITSELGRRTAARELIGRALDANPNSEIAARAARRIRRGERIRASEITRQLAMATRQRTAPEADD